MSHDINSITSVCDNAVLLEKGRIFAQGEPNRVGNIYHELLFGGPSAAEPPAETTVSDLATRSRVEINSAAYETGNAEDRQTRTSIDVKNLRKVGVSGATPKPYPIEMARDCCESAGLETDGRSISAPVSRQVLDLPSTDSGAGTAQGRGAPAEPTSPGERDDFLAT